MIKYGTIEVARKIYLNEWIVEAKHIGNPIVRMTNELWDAMELGVGAPTIGRVFEYAQYNLLIIALEPKKNLIICVNKDSSYWWLGFLLYRLSAFLGWGLYA
jgi:hypothetical protein